MQHVCSMQSKIKQAYVIRYLATDWHENGVGSPSAGLHLVIKIFKFTWVCCHDVVQTEIDNKLGTVLDGALHRPDTGCTFA